MATRLQIDGLGTIEVGDEFKSMSPDEQNAFVGHITEQAGKGAKSSLSTAPADKYQQAAIAENEALKKAGISNEGGYKERILQGMTFGGADEVLAVLETPLEMIRQGTFNPAEGYRYAKAVQNLKLEQARKGTGLLGDIVEAAGGIGSGVGLARGGLSLIRPGQGLLARTGAMAGEGAGYGGVTGLLQGEGGLSERLPGAAKGAAGGAVIGGAIPIAGKAISAAGAPIVSNILARTDPEGAARARVARALSESGRTPQEANQAISDAAAAGQDVFTLADALGNPGQRLLSTVGRAPGEGRTNVVEFLNARQAGQAGRVGDIIEEGLGANATARKTADQLSKQAMEESRPLYEKAFRGGSMAPLESQFESAYAEAAKTTSQAAKDLTEARQTQLFAKAKLSNAGEDVYGANSALQDLREADAAISMAEKDYSSAQRSETNILGRLRRAQTDKSINTPGAIWSPRIQKFLNDPITQSGIKRGLEIQRLESLAAGKRFNPTEFAITSIDESGNPIVGKVPNMRTINVVKKGFDAILEDYRNPITGKLALDERGRAVEMVRKSFLHEIDKLNPEYAKARAAYAGPAQVREAIGKGEYAATRGRGEDTLSRFGELTRPNKQGFRIGYADKLREGIERGAEGVNAARRFTSQKYETELPALSLHQGEQLPGAPDELSRRLARENVMFETRRQATGGSQTAENLADAAASEIDPRLVMSLLQGRVGEAGKHAFRAASDVMGGNTPEVRRRVGGLLLQRGGQSTIEELAQEIADKTARRQGLLARFGQYATPGVGEFAGQRR